MRKAVEFLFDVGSPNAYIAYTQLPAIAKRTGADIIWTPMLLGGVFKATGNRSPAEIPAKAAYMRVDGQRFIQRYDIPFERNPDFPINTLALMRGALAYQIDGNFFGYLDCVFDAMWIHPKNLNDPEVVAATLLAGGIDPADFLDRIGRQEVKDKLRTNTENAVERGVFGAPTFFVDDEMFFGQDRLDMIEESLRS